MTDDKRPPDSIADIEPQAKIGGTYWPAPSKAMMDAMIADRMKNPDLFRNMHLQQWTRPEVKELRDVRLNDIAGIECRKCGNHNPNKLGVIVTPDVSTDGHIRGWTIVGLRCEQCNTELRKGPL